MFLHSEIITPPEMIPETKTARTDKNEESPYMARPSNENCDARPVNVIAYLYSCPIKPILNKPGGAYWGFTNQVDIP